MSEVRAKDNYEQWVKFFLLAIKESAEDAVDTIKKLSALHDKNVSIIESFGRQAKTARLLFDYIEKHPIIDIGKTAADLEISFNTASSYIGRLVECGILIQTNNVERKRVFSYEDYLSILRKDT
jgi:Fic family protein